MRVIRGDYLAVFTIVICCFLVLPSISAADRYEVLKEVVLGPGIYKETISTIPTFSRTAGVITASSSLKGISISVQNGTEGSRHRVASAQVFLNGVEVFGQNDFNHHYMSMSESLDYPEGLSWMDLEVKVNGSKKSQLMVKLTGIYEDEKQVTYYWDNDGDGWGGMIPCTSPLPGCVDNTGDPDDIPLF